MAPGGSEHPPRLTVVPGGRGTAPAPETQASPKIAADPGAARDLLTLGTGLVLTAVLLARVGSWAHALGPFQILYAIGFAFYALAVSRARPHAIPRAIPRAGLIVFGVAAAARLALLPVTPALSDDIYRYVWEGRVAAHGESPYRLSPASPELAPLRDRTIHPRINHPELATIYPPLAIAGFALVAALSPTVLAMKSWVLLHDLVLVGILIAWARRRGLGAQAAIAYAWNPLALVEHAGSGHHDPTSIVWLIAALVLAERRPVASALALATGVLVKLAPLVALPFLLARWPWRARITALLTIGLGLGWFWRETRGADSGLWAYAHRWSNNELVFALLARWLGDPLARGVGIAALALLAAGLAFAWRDREPAAGARTTMRAGFLLSPVAHPWYLGWVLAFEPLGPSAPWLLLSLTAILSYGVLAPALEGSRFHLSLAWRAFEYGLPLGLALSMAAARRMRRDSGRSG